MTGGNAREAVGPLLDAIGWGRALHELVLDERGQPIDYITLEVSELYERLLGVPRHLVEGQPASTLLPAPELAHWLGIFGKVGLGGPPELYQIYSPSNRKHFRGYAYGAGPGRFAVAFEDITERKRSEERLRESEERYRTLVETADDVILLTDLEGRYLFRNNAFYTSLGYAVGEEIDTDGYARVHPDDVATLRGHTATLLESGALTSEYRVRHRDGRYLTRVARSRLIRDSEGQPKAFLSILRDVTERKWMEEALRDGLAFSQTILDIAPVGIATYSAAGQCLSANQAAAQIAGSTVGEVVQQNLFKLTKANHPDFVKAAQEVLVTGRPNEQEFSFTTVFGKHVRLRVHFARFSDNGEDRLLLVLQDITQSKRVEEELRASREGLDLALRSAQLGVWHWDLPKQSRAFDDQVLALLGLDPASFRGTAEEFFRTIHPEDRPGIEAALAQTLATEAPYRSEYRVVWPDGSVHDISARGRLVLDESGRPARINGVLWDVTEPKAAERERRALQEQLLHAQKMDSLGTLAGGIAHDFNNLLGVIQSGVELVMLDCDMVESQVAANMRTDLDRVLRATRRAATLVQQILSFSRKTTTDKQPLQLRAVVKEACRFMRATLPTTVELAQRLSTRGPTVANATQIEQVLMNLLTNANQAMPDGGRIEVRLDETVPTAALRARHPNLGHDRVNRLTVSDSGEGMSSEQVGRIFEPFFTTRPKGKGTGLGLAVVHGIVTSHGGAVEVSSTLGKGSTFEVYLPWVELTDQAHPAQGRASTGTERIMLVDDEESLVALESCALGRLGYKTQSFTSSLDALAAFKANPEAFDAVVSDVTMPNLPGDALAIELLRVRPDLPVVLLTGMSDRVTPEQAREIGVEAYLHKPLSTAELSLCLRRIFDGD